MPSAICTQTLLLFLFRAFLNIDNVLISPTRERGTATGLWGKLHNEELHDLQSRPAITRLMHSRSSRYEISWTCTTHEDTRNSFEI
jgi:hypothetical protein